MTDARRFLPLMILLVIGIFAMPIGCGDDDDDDDSAAPVDDDDDNDTADDDDVADDDIADDDDDDDDDAVDDDDDDTADDDDDDVSPSTEDCEDYGYTDTPTIVRGPYLQHVTRKTMRILWQTDIESNTVVRFGEDESLGYFQCDTEKKLYHEIEIVGLSPEMQYNYLVRSDGAQSEPSTFATAVNETSPYAFAVYGDSRSIPANHALVAQGMLDQGPDFVFNVGDVVGDGWTFDHYDEQHFIPAGELMKQIPMYVSIGNHEGEAIFFYNLFSFPDPEKYYSFDYGNARIISLNTNRLYIQGTPQYVWLESELQRAQDDNKEFIFVMAHHPAWSEGWDSPGYTGELLMRFMVIPLLEQYDVDMFFAGHTHDYERGLKNGMYHIITGGGGSSLDSFQQDFDFITVYESRHHFVLVEVNGNTADFSAMDPDGTVFDSWTITH